MQTFKDTLKRTLPDPALNLLRETYDALRRAPELPGAAFHPWRRESLRRLAALKDSHTGERCFLIGNGPSLKQTDLSRLRGEYTLGANRFYLAFPEMGFPTTYYMTVNDLIAEQSGAELCALNMPVFVSWRMRKWLKPAPNLIYLYTSYTGRKFAHDLGGRVWEGGTVTYVGLQIAFHLGFKQVILIGVDHNYTTPGKPNETVVSEGDDPNHFHPGYFGKGYRWQLPDIVSWERAYQLAREHYEAAGREVIDATVGGKLQVFKKAQYESLF